MFEFEVFWVVTPCSVVVGCQRFRGPASYHITPPHNSQYLDLKHHHRESFKTRIFYVTYNFICLLRSKFVVPLWGRTHTERGSEQVAE